jgi:hypothetical protein
VVAAAIGGGAGARVIGICLGPAAAGLATVFLSATSFTLSWEHSVERIPWEEDYRIEGTRLVLGEARVKGSGAGMEPPPESVLRDGWWRFHPDLPPLPELRLGNSAVGEYTLCWAGGCSALSQLVQGDTIVLWVCGLEP